MQKRIALKASQNRSERSTATGLSAEVRSAIHRVVNADEFCVEDGRYMATAALKRALKELGTEMGRAERATKKPSAALLRQQQAVKRARASESKAKRAVVRLMTTVASLEGTIRTLNAKNAKLAARAADTEREKLRLEAREIKTREAARRAVLPDVAKEALEQIEIGYCPICRLKLPALEALYFDTEFRAHVDSHLKNPSNKR